MLILGAMLILERGAAYFFSIYLLCTALLILGVIPILEQYGIQHLIQILIISLEIIWLNYLGMRKCNNELKYFILLFSNMAFFVFYRKCP